jgi:phage terminase large subunit-like protein
VIFHRKGDIEYERELLSFPRGKRDDRIDAMSMWLLLDINTSSGTVKQYRPHWTGYGRKK